jgi:CDP-4-dehydro-6-deoxyglucose reductase
MHPAMPSKWYECRLISSLEIAPLTKIFTLGLSDEDPFSFLPGQFITLDLPIHEKRLYRWRSYSIANAPNEDRILELCIVKNEGGLGTQYLFDTLKIGDILRFKGPDGGFVLPENLPEMLTLICTGTGVAPFRSMLRELSKHPKQTPPVRLIFGTRKWEHILFLEEWRELKKILPDFQLHIALSRAETIPRDEPGFVHFYKGYVHQIYQNKDLMEIHKGVSYICGWQNMVDEAQKNLLVLGVPPSQIKTELYG